MQTCDARRVRAIGTALLTTLLIAGCDSAVNPQTASVPTDRTEQPTVPPPPGDSTPKAIDSGTRVASQANEKPGASGAASQSTVGTAASGAPPYTLQGAPEGNPSPAVGEPPKK
jgi:hypothetical protein